MRKIVGGVLRGALSDHIVVGLCIWAAYEVGRSDENRQKLKRAVRAEMYMDAYKPEVYN